MTILSETAEYIPDIAETGLMEVPATAANKDVMAAKLTANPPVKKFEHVPAYLYLYHIKFDGGQISVDHQLYYTEGASGRAEDRPSIAYADIPGLVQKIASGNVIAPETFGADFVNDAGHWNRVSYIAFLLDDPSWKFCDGTSGEQPPAVFASQKGSGPNKCFYDGAVRSLDLDGRRASLFYCVNHMRKGNLKYPQSDKPGEKEEHKYDLYLKHEFAGNAPDMVVVFDPGGDNTGPPVPPFGSEDG